VPLNDGAVAAQNLDDEQRDNCILSSIAFFLSPNSVLAAKHRPFFLSSFRTFLSLFSSSHYSSTFHFIIAAPTTSKPFIGM
jgi:hypothetical protein